MKPRELDVLVGVARGETAAETAKRLQLSTDTVKSHRKSALRSLGARSMPQAMYLAGDEISEAMGK